MKNKNTLFCLLFLFISILTSVAQSNQPTVTAMEQQVVIDSINHLLNKNYVFPETASTMANLLSANLKKGDYTTTTDAVLFSERLTSDLQSISKDRHIRVRLNPEYIKEVNESKSQNPNNNQIPPAMLEELKMKNYGFKEVKILDGNIGYLDLRNFEDPQFAGETAVSAMNFLANSNALIIDLRKNGGGSPAMIQLISSYLFTAEPVHLNNFYFRPSNENTQTWTLPYVTGKRRPDIDVYVLTSKGTFSAAEEFTYNLKNLKRATIIGETTGGGANPGDELIINDRFTIFVPFGRAINPITNTNWEGTGVKPDIEVPASDALFIAQQKALEKLAKKETSNPQSIYPWLLTSLKVKQNPVKLDEKQLKEFVGSYGSKTVTLQGDKLIFSLSSYRQAVLIPMGGDLFDVEEKLIHVQFIREGKKITGIRIENVNGNTESYKKLK
ncbi:S41 family peptidase [Flavobacterium sp. 5]|uniref:S41 family peptidase n=1 Tax=Flavobacterium sp. 5 TaxID=2035199 RepID=UPI000C2B6607|nr:S41 family peptidase [Flavobacterium sp. 5]PKB15291.1 peptidase S41-like protein [Flavobacterium sp. 5]